MRKDVLIESNELYDSEQLPVPLINTSSINTINDIHNLS